MKYEKLNSYSFEGKMSALSTHDWVLVVNPYGKLGETVVMDREEAAKGHVPLRPSFPTNLALDGDGNTVETEETRHLEVFIR